MHIMKHLLQDYSTSTLFFFLIQQVFWFQQVQQDNVPVHKTSSMKAWFAKVSEYEYEET